MRRTMYHGSPERFQTLRAGSWVTPYRRDAQIFGVPWGTSDLDSRTKFPPDGRPPRTLWLREDVQMEDGPVYLYEVSVEAHGVLSAKTNLGGSYPWNHQVLHDTPVRLINVSLRSAFWRR